MDKINDYINKKIDTKLNIIIFTFYEVRVGLELYEDEANEVLDMCQEELEDLGYKVYHTGEKYSYENITKIVGDNQLMVAVKKK